MPYYTYKCKECEHEFFEHQSINDREIPCGKPCPNCEKEGTVFKEFSHSMNYDMVDPLKRAGSGWNDVLNKIKKGSGKDNSIRTR